jgi:hypothetical protein
MRRVKEIMVVVTEQTVKPKDNIVMRVFKDPR